MGERWRRISAAGMDAMKDKRSSVHSSKRKRVVDSVVLNTVNDVLERGYY